MEPTRRQPTPAPHMEQHVLRPKPPPLHGSVAQAIYGGPPSHRAMPKGSAEEESRPWRAWRNDPQYSNVVPPMLPSSPEVPLPLISPPQVRYVDPANMEHV